MSPNNRLESDALPFGYAPRKNAAEAKRYPSGKHARNPIGIIVNMGGEMARIPRFLSAIACCVLVPFFGTSAYSSNGALLDCDRFEGEQEFQVYIDEAQGYVLYNAQFRDSYARERLYSVVGGEEGEAIELDEGLDIQVSTDHHIQAGDETSSFIFAKETATYAYARTMFIPNKDGKLVAFGMHHSGECSMNPFAQPE